MNCSPCAVCSLNLAENHFGKTHETMWRSFLNLPFLPHPPLTPWPVHKQGLFVLDLKHLHLPPPLHSTTLALVPATTLSPRMSSSHLTLVPHSWTPLHPTSTISVWQPEGSFKNVNQNTSLCFPSYLDWKARGLPWLMQPCELLPHVSIPSLAAAIELHRPCVTFFHQAHPPPPSPGILLFFSF